MPLIPWVKSEIKDERLRGTYVFQCLRVFVAL